MDFAGDVWRQLRVNTIHFSNTASLTEGIRRALRDGQEPLISVAFDIFIKGTAFAKILNAQSKDVLDPEDFITVADVSSEAACDGLACDHVVVIGSDSMGGSASGYSGDALIIKDSSFVKPWGVAGADVMAFKGAEVPSIRF